MWPFFVSLVFLYVTEKSFLHGHIITLKDSLPELYVLSLVLSLLKGKTNAIVTGVVLVIMVLLTTIEVFLMNHFKLNFMSDVICLMMESNTSETSQFLDVFVMQWGTLKYVAVLVLGIAMYALLARFKDLIELTFIMSYFFTRSGFLATNAFHDFAPPPLGMGLMLS